MVLVRHETSGIINYNIPASGLLLPFSTTFGSSYRAPAPYFDPRSLRPVRSAGRQFVDPHPAPKAQADYGSAIVRTPDHDYFGIWLSV